MKKLFGNIVADVGAVSFIYLVMGMVFASEAVRFNSMLVILLGVLIGVCSAVYQIRRFSLLTKTGIQLVGSLLSFLVIAYIGDWFPMKLGIIATSSLMFVLIFLFIWSMFYFAEKRELERINRKIK
ncbi:DUF3021 domain-containing protein [Lactobacillus sp. YT155]|uniref:DUF3021 domain-containing protein n=1 Tax=Lactobacillus sp. YT155 TaxID=3060955 RepID=UPI00265ED01B|nr:DUF3021 domain-containing protein [Lactobacillus sp. YT155]MDO1604710.1 DUF3021 domain-containing protein [Lactobacillus sp. YT155]